MAIDPNKLEQILNDPDFMALPESEQDSFLDEISSQEPVQTVQAEPQKPDIMGGVLRAVGGPPAILATNPELIPATGQMVGGIFGGLPGAVAGSTVGEAGRQAVENLTGKRKGFDTGEMAKTAGVTGLVEGLTRGAGRLFFRKQLSNELLTKLSKKLSGMKEEMIANPSIQTLAEPIEKTISEAYEMLPEPVKRGGADGVIRRWVSYLKENPVLNANDLIAMETDLGKAATYGQTVRGVFQPAEVPNPATNKVAQIGRRKVSDVVERVSEGSGQKGFKETSKKISKLLEKYPDFDPTKGYGSFSGRMGTAIGTTALTGNPIAGVGAYAAEKFLQNPGVRNALFRGVRNPAVSTAGKGAKVGITELLKKILGGG